MKGSHPQQQLVERRDRGVIRHASESYGVSLEGVPLTVSLPDSGNAEIVVLAAIHGDEPETAVAVSEALRCISRGDLQAAVILCGNPDGMLRGTRGNGRGVDLNRNFPTSNLVTLELEDASLYTLKDRHVPILIDLMTGRIELEA